jgi:hypothetical protein
MAESTDFSASTSWGMAGGAAPNVGAGTVAMAMGSSRLTTGAAPVS